MTLILVVPLASPLVLAIAVLGWKLAAIVVPAVVPAVVGPAVP